MQHLQHLLSPVLLLLLASCTSTGSKPKKKEAESWQHHSTLHFTLHAQTGVRSAQHLKSIGQKMETIQQQLLTLLNENSPQKLELYFLTDRQTLTAYTGYSARGYTNTQKGILYFVDKDPIHLPLKHETMHALSWRLWGTPKEYWISEGIAVFASNNCASYTLPTLAHAMHREQKLVPFQNLIDAFDFRALEPSLQAASMVQFIYDTYGIAALKAFWQKGWQQAGSITGISPQKLEQQWKAWFGQERINEPVNWNIIKEQGCE